MDRSDATMSRGVDFEEPAVFQPAKRRVVVDWDGTLTEDDTWPGMGRWLPGAVEALRYLAREFDEVMIYTCRTANVDVDEITHRSNVDQVSLIRLMIDDAGLPPNVQLWLHDYKPMAEYYIDNRGVRFTGDWESLMTELFPAMVNEPTGIEVIGHAIRTFETGATRDTEGGKLDYEGFLSPVVLRRYAEYMQKHSVQSDGQIRPSDNWQKGMPRDVYMKSGFRHFMDWWGNHRGDAGGEDPDLEEALCALIFNASGYLFELLRGGAK